MSLAEMRDAGDAEVGMFVCMLRRKRVEDCKTFIVCAKSSDVTMSNRVGVWRSWSWTME